MQRVGIKRLRSKERSHRQIDGDLDNIEGYMEFMNQSDDRELALEYQGRSMYSQERYSE